MSQSVCGEIDSLRKKKSRSDHRQERQIVFLVSRGAESRNELLSIEQSQVIEDFSHSQHFKWIPQLLLGRVGEQEEANKDLEVVYTNPGIH